MSAPSAAPALPPERERQLVETLHATWHASPGGCVPGRPCDVFSRSLGVVAVLGPVVAGWLVEDVERARDALAREWIADVEDAKTNLRRLMEGA